MGASLIAASRDNAGIDLVAIDYFRFGPLTVAGRELPPASRAAFEANAQRFGVEATLFEGDTLEVLRGGALAGRKVGVFFYDACHDCEPQLEALTLVEPFLTDTALLIVDNYDWEGPRRAVQQYLAMQPRARLLVAVAGAAEGQDWWWDGTAVVAWDGTG
jgi:hypothetical protein